MSYPGLKSLLDYFKRAGKHAKRHRVACICSARDMRPRIVVGLLRESSSRILWVVTRDIFQREFEVTKLSKLGDYDNRLSRV